MADVIPRDPTEAQAADAHTVQECIKQELATIRTAWVELAAHLFTFHEGAMWRDLGHESFESWIASPEIGLQRTAVFQLISVHRQLVIERGVQSTELARVEWSNLQETLPAIRRGHVTVQEALADVEALSQRDLRDRYRAMTTRAPGEPEPLLDASTEPEYATCPACGSRYEVRQ